MPISQPDTASPATDWPPGVRVVVVNLMAAAGRSAIVLAGGRSSRMGIDKAGLSWAGTAMLERTVAELARGFDDVVVVARADQRFALSGQAGAAVRMIPDHKPFEGPVAALRQGLAAVHAQAAFACGCDLPFLNLELAVALFEMASGHEAVIPLVGGRMQVLHAVYNKSGMRALGAMIGRGERKLQEVARMLRVRTVSEDEMRRYDPDLRSFFNVNTPQDYARAVRMIRNPKAPKR